MMQEPSCRKDSPDCFRRRTLLWSFRTDWPTGGGNTVLKRRDESPQTIQKHLKDDKLPLKGLLRGRPLAAPGTLVFCAMTPSLEEFCGPPGPWLFSGPSSFSLKSDRSLLLLESESRLEDCPLSSRLNFWDWLWSKEAGTSSIPSALASPNIGEPEVDDGISPASHSSLGTAPSPCDEVGAGEEEELGEVDAESAGTGVGRIPLGGSAIVKRFGFRSGADVWAWGSDPERPAKEVWVVFSPYAKNGLAGSLEACRKRFWWLFEVLKTDCRPRPPTQVPLFPAFMGVF